ncbi:hypothetical protein A2U01_0026381 [Trifolium medium]|uniref:Uncharacterized protein n=1 Tax=Trifolium medium TaxID=97028 RepID=A0A392P1F1_9FABA|nr:hypothetical protein [Trifolium medium]
MNITGLLHFIHDGKDLDIARIISTEMKSIASSGVTDFSRPKCPLAFPGLIMGLITKARITIPQHVHEQLGTIDDNYVHRHCKPKRNTTPAAPEHPTASHEASAAPTQSFTDQQLLYHLMDQNATNHRADVTMYEAMYRMSMSEPLMEPTLFQTHIARPGDRPPFGEGASTAAAAAGDGVDDDAFDQAAADAFIDDEEATQSGGDDEMHDL